MLKNKPNEIFRKNFFVGWALVYFTTKWPIRAETQDQMFGRHLQILVQLSQARIR